jgi:peptide deformylase
MAVLQIRIYGDPILTKKAESIRNINEKIVELAQSMVKTMHSAPGIGLSAPQVNTSKRLITVDLSVGEKSEDLIILANPELLTYEGEIISEEGCLSIPGIQEKVPRSARIMVKGIDIKGNEKVIEAEGLLARVLSHEIDHLNGKLFIDYLSPLKRSLIRKKLKKQLEAKKS